MKTLDIFVCQLWWGFFCRHLHVYFEYFIYESQSAVNILTMALPGVYVLKQVTTLPAHLCPQEQWGQSCWTIADPWVMSRWMRWANRIAEWILILDWLQSLTQARVPAWRINQSMISLLRPWMDSRFRSVTTGGRCFSSSMLPPSEGQQ